MTARRWPVSANAVLLLLASWFALAYLSLQPQADASVLAAVFPPWWGAERTFAAAASTGAEIIRTGAIPTVVVLRPIGDNGLVRLREAGAWLVLDPKAIDGCLTGAAL